MVTTHFLSIILSIIIILLILRNDKKIAKDNTIDILSFLLIPSTGIYSIFLYSQKMTSFSWGMVITILAVLIIIIIDIVKFGYQTTKFSSLLIILGVGFPLFVSLVVYPAYRSKFNKNELQTNLGDFLIINDYILGFITGLVGYIVVMVAYQVINKKVK